MFPADYPQTAEAARAYVYGQWAGNKRGSAYDPKRCAAEDFQSGGYVPRQCHRPAGYGPNKLFCRGHARRLSNWLAKQKGAP